MLMNNLDPEVAERPQDLVVYGGTGRAARSWEAFDAIVRTLRGLGDDETLLVQSGKPVGVFRTHDLAPRVLISNSMLVPRWADWDTFRDLEHAGLTMYGQMTAGSWIYIGTQGILQGTYETFAEAASQRFGGSLDGTVTLTGGLGGMGGAQPLAAVMAGAAFLAADVDPTRVEKRLETGYLDEVSPTIDAAIDRALALKAARRAGNIITRATRDGDSWLINGTKAWVTHGGESDYYLVFARTGDTGAKGVSCLFAPADTPGVARAKLEHKMGMQSSPTAQITFDDARVPADHLIGEEGQGFRIAMEALDGGRLGIASCSVGLARAALDAAVSFARQREQFGRAVIDFQGIAFMLADMATQVEAARALTQDTARRRDAGASYAKQAAMAKLFASDTAMRVATDAVQVHGGYGYVDEFPVERYMREAKVLQIVEGTNQIQRVVIARHLHRGS